MLGCAVSLPVRTTFSGPVRFTLFALFESGEKDIEFAAPRVNLRDCFEAEMHFRGKITEADMDDARTLLRSRGFWPKLVLRNWYGTLLLCLIAWATIHGILASATPNWRALGMLWAVVAAVFAWSTYRVRRDKSRQFATLTARLPDWISLNDDGVRSEGPDGAKSLFPWATFKNWREGKRVILLHPANGAGPIVLPVAEMSDVERETVRQYLRVRFPSQSGTLQPER